MNTLEKTYGRAIKTVVILIRPFKKLLIETLCEVHIFINGRAVEILRNDGYLEADEFYTKNMRELNKGVVWADQNFRSREHFYSPYDHKGLYGCRSSKQRFRQYYANALVYRESGDADKALFYLGAAVHLVQDSTIPQHGSVNLLKSHRGYEQWIKDVYDSFVHYSVNAGGIYLSNPYCYIECNAKKSIEAYRRYSLIQNERDRYFRISNITFPLAQRTTAGCLMNFYNTMVEMGRGDVPAGQSDCRCSCEDHLV